MEQRTRKTINIDKALHLRNDIDYIYQEKEVEENSPVVNAWIGQIEDDIKKS